MFSQLFLHLLTTRRFPGWKRRLALLRRVRHLDGDSFAAWSQAATERHIRWAVRNVPYWQQRGRSFDRLEDLPILGRKDVQENEEDLLDPAWPRCRLVRETSGGSTGEPVAVWQDRGYLAWDEATEFHVLESWGIEPWARRAWVWGADRDLQAVTPRERLYARLLDWRVINAFRLGEEHLEEAADVLERQQPAYILGYASALDLLARWLLANRPDHRIRPRAIRSSAETLHPAARAVVERAFEAPVHDFYGSRECASIAAQCPAGGMHVQAHGRVVEIVDDDGRLLGPGRPGRVLVTDLTNHAFGLLRYETGDVASWAEPGPCPCGCVYPRLAALHGRTSDFLTTPAGERIHGEWFTHLFYGREGVSRFQVYQPTLRRLEVRTVGTATAQDLADVLDQIGERMGEAVEVTWRSVDEIDTTATGKRRFTLSDVPFLPEVR